MYCTVHGSSRISAVDLSTPLPSLTNKRPSPPPLPSTHSPPYPPLTICFIFFPPPPPPPVHPAVRRPLGRWAEERGGKTAQLLSLLLHFLTLHLILRHCLISGLRKKTFSSSPVLIPDGFIKGGKAPMEKAIKPRGRVVGIVTQTRWAF